MTGFLLECHDFISELLVLYNQNTEPILPASLVQIRDNLNVRLSGYLGTDSPKPSGISLSLDDTGSMSAEDRHLNVRNEYWHISIRFGGNLYRDGFDPYAFISYLADFGTIIKIATISDTMPSMDHFDHEQCYLGLEIDFDTQSDKEAIESVFSFIKDDSTIRILPPQTHIGDYIDLIHSLPETPMRIGEILTSIGTLTRAELERALALQHAVPGEDQCGSPRSNSLIGTIMLEEGMVPQPVLDAALEKQKDISRSEEKKNMSMRIDSEKIDNLINAVGELVIAGANIRQQAENSGIPQYIQSSLSLQRLIEDIRDRTMGIRMVKVGDTFRRFERIVRDLARETGKEIEFCVQGGETELDKTLVEKISEPLVHLIRNAVDHGIARPDERERKGKPARGRIILNAYHEAGSFVIEITDDGQGLAREVILPKAIARGMLQDGIEIPDADLWNVIFEPGFSTAEKVTTISGRGVGMDVVKKTIESLRGTVSIENKSGHGMTVKINLPLTLAIIDGFMIQVDSNYYILPLDMVVEGCEATGDALTARDGGNFYNLRGELLPYVRLREFLGAEAEAIDKQNMLIVEHARKKIGLVADLLIGEFQTVIKPLGRLFRGLDWISGATILGSGEVAFILDVPKLIARC